MIACRDGTRRQLDLMRPGELRPWPRELPRPPPHNATIRDGLLELGGAAIPIEDGHGVVSRDGRFAASLTSHYASRAEGR